MNKKMILVKVLEIYKGEKWIGNISVSEDLEVTDNLKYGYKVKEKKSKKEMFQKLKSKKLSDYIEPLHNTFSTVNF